ncbi:hypothetical protein FRC11_007303 [Ceratobasidium sp. 423]|nr:hypothetical protein FRC11_007303 [Ceratobasidium sp. 423]
MGQPSLPDSTVNAPIDINGIDHILRELVTCVEKFKCPPELDFPPNNQNPLILLNNEKNKPFLNQLRKLNGLRAKWDQIPKQRNEQLEAKRTATGLAIGRALLRMKEYQQRLHAKYAKAQAQVHRQRLTLPA